MTKKTTMVSIRKETVEKIKAALSKYASLLDTELDSSLNDETLKEDYRKDLKEVTVLESAFQKEVKESEDKETINALFEERKKLFEQFCSGKIDEQIFHYKDDRIVDDLRDILDEYQQ